MSGTQSAPSQPSYDLDSDASSRHFFSTIKLPDSDNFAIIFDHENALAAANLDRDGLKQWMQDHENDHGTRWLHFWNSPGQRSMFEDLASTYRLSPRLLNLICPKAQPSSPPQPADPSQDTIRNRLRMYAPRASKVNDVEKTVELPTVQSPASTSIQSPAALSFSTVVDNLWHFHSIDWGHRYVHIGVNTLSVVPGVEHSPTSDKPAGQRLWTSILLCDDGTVISSSERPPQTQSEEIRKAANEMAKRHVLTIARSLSRLPTTHSSMDNDVMNVTIRPGPPDPLAAARPFGGVERMECSSLLFYYLFDDWMTTYALIAQREHPYRHSLELVRQALTDAPDAKLLETLHSIGRQLIVLQLMYQSYGTVITRLLLRYQRTPYTAMNLNADGSYGHRGTGAVDAGTAIYTGHAPSSPFATYDNQDRIGLFTTSMSTVQLSFLATGRFERLLDRIHLYALNEINHCLAEKESLVLMTFNLLALSESRSVERLTRTTILLAKATILFLPVSLLTGYFSLSVGDIDKLYSLRTYWFSFLTVALLSITFLSLFGIATGTVEGKLVYRSLHKALWDKSVAAVLRKMR